MKRVLIFLICILSLSCTKKIKKNEAFNSDVKVESKKVIGFSIDTLAIERWQRDLDVFTSKVREMDAEVIVQNAGNSIDEQNRQLMYLAERNVDVLVVLPKNAVSFADTISKIRAKGIPVISYDRLMLNCDIDLYITINSEKVGELMAQGTIARKPGNSWFCFLGPEEDFNMTLIKNGIDKAIKDSKVQINHLYYTNGWDYDLAFQEMSRLIADNRIPDAIICGNDAVASSVIQAVKQFYRGKHICICGQDADIAACQNIIQKDQDFTVYKPISKLAELTAEYAVNLANGKTISELDIKDTINNGSRDIPVVWLEPQIVDESNMDKVIIESGFHSHNEVYRTN
ncbi:MAG: substrate-binding domain-containing protein [Treponema sp.]|nr:substrate-binding domain-containing protein [Treponema sp.]